MTEVREIQQFYARHMQAIDDGAVDAWLDTFTDDASIANNTGAEPARGRDTIAAVARRLVAGAIDRSVIHRHWTGMLDVVTESDGTVRATSYALVVETARGGQPALWRSTVCRDVLVHDGGRWRIRQRYVTHDDLD
jgi:uncharacterized protein (TIGR02246 family)